MLPVWVSGAAAEGRKAAGPVSACQGHGLLLLQGRAAAGCLFLGMAVPVGAGRTLLKWPAKEPAGAFRWGQGQGALYFGPREERGLQAGWGAFRTDCPSQMQRTSCCRPPPERSLRPPYRKNTFNLLVTVGRRTLSPALGKRDTRKFQKPLISAAMKLHTLQ